MTSTATLPAVGSIIPVGKKKRSGRVKSARIADNGYTAVITVAVNGCDVTITRDMD